MNNNNLTYNLFLKKCLWLLFIGIFFSNSAIYYYWLIEQNTYTIELCDLKDIEHESEKDQKKNEEDSDDKIPVAGAVFEFLRTKIQQNALSFICFDDTHHLETPTPPPQFMLS